MPRRHGILSRMSGTNLRRDEALALLEWQIAMGADEAIGEIARDWLSPAPAAAVAPR